MVIEHPIGQSIGMVVGKLSRLAMLVVLLVLAFESLASQEAVSELLPSYPRAERTEFTDSKEVATHEIILGRIKRVGGIEQPETSEFVVGRRITSTWFIPNEERTDVVRDFYRERLVQKGEILFECKGRGCGSSSYWANSVFKRSVLYGPEQFQHYFLTRIERGGITYYVSTYIALRGTRKLYAHADVIVAEGTRANTTGGVGIVSSLESKGFFIIDAGNEKAKMEDIVEAMTLKPLMRIAIVTHSKKQRGESVDQAIARSEKTAKDLVGQLIASGVNRSRVQGYGVGPLSPMERGVVDRTEIVLISID